MKQFLVNCITLTHLASFNWQTPSSYTYFSLNSVYGIYTILSMQVVVHRWSFSIRSSAQHTNNRVASSSSANDDNVCIRCGSLMLLTRKCMSLPFATLLTNSIARNNVRDRRKLQNGGEKLASLDNKDYDYSGMNAAKREKI